MICYSDRILLFRLMQNQRNSQTTLRLAPAGWGIHTYVCQHRRAHPWGIPPSRGKWLYHLCHPSGSGADTANPLHVFNVAHAKPWSRAKHPTSFSHWRPRSCSCGGRIRPNPGLNQRSAAANPPRLCSQRLQVRLREMSLPLPAKTELPAFRLPFPSPAEQITTCQERCKQDIRVSRNRLGGPYCVRLSPLGGSRSCQCDGLTGRDRQHPSITPLTAWNAAISLAESSSQADRLRGAVNEANVLCDRAAPEGISHSRSCLSRATAPYSSSWREVNKYQSWRD